MPFDEINAPIRKPTPTGSRSTTDENAPVAVAVYTCGAKKGKGNRVYVTFLLHLSLLEKLGWNLSERITVREGTGRDLGLLQFASDPNGSSIVLAASKGITKGNRVPMQYVVRIAADRLKHNRIVTFVPPGTGALMSTTSAERYETFGSTLTVKLPNFPDSIRLPPLTA